MENDNLFKKLGELIGNEPISMEEAERRFAESDLDTGYDALADLLYDSPELLVVDKDNNTVYSKYRVKIKPGSSRMARGSPGRREHGANERDVYQQDIA